jgi:fido (protein-threonine AMPylation protein)
MQPADCPVWEYKHHPRRREIRLRTRELLVAIRSGRIDARQHATDTRTVHEELFRELTPMNCPYYAGHYRGEPYRCLREYAVGIKSDQRVGIRPDLVLSEMSRWRETVRAGLDKLDAAEAASGTTQLLVSYAVSIVSSVFVHLLTIHPYANGNGHAARFVVWTLFGRFGLWPQGFPIDPRPPDPPYTQLVSEYRGGNCEPLEIFFLQQLVE